MKASEVKEFELSFPKDYHAKHLAGQKVTFKVTMKNVQQREIPELNDEFAKGIGKFNSLKEIENNIEEGIKQEKKRKIKQEQHLKIIEKLIDEVEMEIPEVLIDSEVEKMNMELENQLSQMGLNKETYLQQIRSSVEKLENQWREKDAPKRVKAALILRKISVDNKIEPQTKDVQDRVNQVMQHYQMMSQGKEIENLDTQRIYANIKSEMTNEMTLEYLMSL
jgi:trigger factor